MPKITAVTPYKDNTVMVAFDGREPLFVNREIVYKKNIQAGMDIPEAPIDELLHDNELRKAKERALYLMDYSDNTYMGLFKKLSRNYPDDICYEVCDDLASVGVVNDRRYAANLARKLCEVKRFGYYRAVQEMKQKGFTGSVIDEALELYADSEYERLLELIRKKYFSKLDYEDRNKKVTASLVRYGYSFDDVKKALKELEAEFNDE